MIQIDAKATTGSEVVASATAFVPNVGILAAVNALLVAFDGDDPDYVTLVIHRPDDGPPRA